MLIFKELKDENLIKDFLNNFDIPYKKKETDLFFGGFDEDKLFGVCRIKFKEEKVILDYIIISDNYEGDNLGDALLRATLNKLDNMGVKEVVYLFQDDYLIKKGFVRREKDLFVSLPEFFNMKCSNCGDK